MGNSESQPAHGHSHDGNQHGHSHSHGEHSHSSSDEGSGDEHGHSHAHGTHGHSHAKKEGHAHSHGDKECSDDESHSDECSDEEEGHGHSHQGGSHSHSHGGSHSHSHGSASSKFSDPVKWEKKLENPEREGLVKPSEIIKAMGVKEDSSIADIGAGTGYFVVRFAKVATKGKIFALDLEEKMVSFLREKVQKQGLSNVFALQAAADDAHIPEPVDFIFSAQTYHHMQSRPAYLRKLHSSLKAGGKVVIFEDKKSSDYTAKPPANFEGPPESMKLPPKEIEEEFKAAGYKLVSQPDLGLNFHFLQIYKA